MTNVLYEILDNFFFYFTMITIPDVEDGEMLYSTIIFRML